MNDYEQYDLEFVSGSADCPAYMRVRWNADGSVTAFEWWRNPETQIGYGWKRYDVSRVTVDDAPAVLSAFAPSGHTVRCASATIRPWGRDELEIQGVAQRHLAPPPSPPKTEAPSPGAFCVFPFYCPYIVKSNMGHLGRACLEFCQCLLY